MALSEVETTLTSFLDPRAIARLAPSCGSPSRPGCPPLLSAPKHVVGGRQARHTVHRQAAVSVLRGGPGCARPLVRVGRRDSTSPALSPATPPTPAAGEVHETLFSVADPSALSTLHVALAPIPAFADSSTLPWSSTATHSDVDAHETASMMSCPSTSFAPYRRRRRTVGGIRGSRPRSPSFFETATHRVVPGQETP